MIICGDAQEVLSGFPDEYFHCCVTSPPYYGLRDYGVFGQIGQESSPKEYVNNLVQVFREVRRVLRPNGTLWLNLGDSYAGSGKGRNSSGYHSSSGAKQGTNKGSIAGVLSKACTDDDFLKPKDLIGIPWTVAFALRDSGWYLRSDIIWHKPSVMPESVKDRPTRTHEYLFLLSKSPQYYFDQEAIKEPITDSSAQRLLQRSLETQYGSVRANGGQKTNGRMKAVGTKPYDSSQKGGGTNMPGHSGYFTADGRCLIRPTRNKRSVWTVSNTPFKGAHFAVFPEKLIEPCILAGCPPGGRVLDPFVGSGTTVLVAKKLGRDGVGIDLNPDYVEMAKRRLNEVG